MPYSFRLVSASASTKYVPSAEETKRVPIFADGDVRISTATEWVLDSTTVYALQISLDSGARSLLLAQVPVHQCFTHEVRSDLRHSRVGELGLSPILPVCRHVEVPIISDT